MVFIRSPALKSCKTLDYNKNAVSVSDVMHDLTLKTELSKDSFVIYYNGKLVHSHQIIPNDAHIDVCFRVFGGKGGFGSMLRAIGAQIEKTTNREACRDLSGRRLRDINEEQRLKRWLAKKAEREADQLKRRKEKLERMKAMPKHDFHDPDYNKERSELPERIDDALSQGLKKSSVLNKRHKANKVDNAEPPLKKQRAWLDDEMPSDLSDHSDLEEPTVGECSQKNSSDSLDICSSSSNPDSSDASTSNSEKFTKELPVKNSKVQETTENELGKLSSKIGDEPSEDDHSEPKASNLSPEPVENSSKGEMPLKSSEDLKETEKADDTVDLLQFEAVKELEALGLDKLKAILMKLGLKCGGTLSERASRLWSVRNLDPKDYPRALRAKPNKS